jgi:collagenase-like PrtC family protease
VSPQIQCDAVVVATHGHISAQAFNAVEAAAQVVAENHSAGHMVKVLTNAIMETMKRYRLEVLAKRVNEILADRILVPFCRWEMTPPLCPESRCLSPKLGVSNF